MMVPDENLVTPPAGDPSPGGALPIVEIYAITQLERELRQCEIVTGLVQSIYRSETRDAEEIQHPYAIILAQDCDLLRDYDCGISQKPRPLNGVLVYEMHPEHVIKQNIAQGKEPLKRLVQNKDERYQYFEAVPAGLDLCGEGVPSLVVDFRRYFTIPADEIYRQLLCSPPIARRRCRVEMPYREHVLCRAAFYMQRVMLPRQHGERPAC